MALRERQAEIQRRKNLIGVKTQSSKPYNILNMNYEESPVGIQFKLKELDNEARRDARSKRMQMMGDSAFNIVNGEDRPNAIGIINKYNQDPMIGSSQATGAGRPIRSVNARIDIGQIEGGKKVYPDQKPVTTQPVELD